MITQPIKFLLPQQTAGALKNFSTLASNVNTRLQAENAISKTDEEKKADEKKVEKKQSSTNVNLSDFGKRQIQSLNMLNSLNTVKEARKNAARAQAAELKKQIDALKEIAAMLGPMAAKTILRQIKQLAQQLRSIAAVLAEPSSQESGGAGVQVADNASAGGESASVDENVNSGAENGQNADEREGEAGAKNAPENNVAAAQKQEEAEKAKKEEEEEAEEDAEATDSDAETRQAAAAGAAASQAAEQAASAAESEVREKEQNKGVNGNHEVASQRRAQGEQERRDAKMVSDLAWELRQLLNWVKGMLPRKDKEDKDSLKEIEKQFGEIDELTQQLNDAADAHINSADALMGMGTETDAGVDAAGAEVSSVDTGGADAAAAAAAVTSISVYA